jgi:hypothetical protein
MKHTTQLQDLGVRDSVTHSEVLHDFVKPPIHGWVFGHLRRRLPEPLTPAQPTEAYDGLTRWTDFWLTARHAPDTSLPHHQHGNDSGWDNATTFGPKRVAFTADLAVLLVLQLVEPARSAGEPGFPDDARRRTETADAIQAALLDELWDGERFLSRPVPGGALSPSAGLLDLMPIMLGDRLPPKVSDRPAEQMETHLAAFGLATERPGLAPLRARRLLARPDLGPRHRPHRGRPAPRRARTPRGRDQRPLARPERNLRLRRELRRPDRSGTERPRLHLDRRQLPADRDHLRRADAEAAATVA